MSYLTLEDKTILAIIVMIVVFIGTVIYLAIPGKEKEMPKE